MCVNMMAVKYKIYTLLTFNLALPSSKEFGVIFIRRSEIRNSNSILT
jgi:hypothetical protein